MKFVTPEFEIWTPDGSDKLNGTALLKHIERVIRVSRESEHLTTDDSYKRLVSHILNQNPQHTTPLEHVSVTVYITCDRGISHELVRHRMATYCQTSTRYINYNSRGGCGFIIPCFLPLQDRINLEEYDAELMDWDEYCNTVEFSTSGKLWADECKHTEDLYRSLIVDHKWKPEEARSKLTNDISTKIVMTMNILSLRNLFRLRTDKHAHPQMRELMIQFLEFLQREIPIVFDDIELPELSDVYGEE